MIGGSGLAQPLQDASCKGFQIVNGSDGLSPVEQAAQIAGHPAVRRGCRPCVLEVQVARFFAAKHDQGLTGGAISGFFRGNEDEQGRSHGDLVV